MAQERYYTGEAQDKDGKPVTGLAFKLVNFSGDVEAATRHVLIYHPHHKNLKLTEKGGDDTAEPKTLGDLAVKPGAIVSASIAAPGQNLASAIVPPPPSAPSPVVTPPPSPAPALSATK